MRYIENKRHRDAVFYNRFGNLLKKVAEIGILCDLKYTLALSDSEKNIHF